MVNDRLKSAIRSAGLTSQELSERIQVDPKTIDRWVASGRQPHAANRRRLALALGADEDFLWPNALSDSQIQEVSQSELVHIYTSRAMIPVAAWETMLANTSESLDVLAFAASFLHDALPNLHDDLRDRASAGVRVRLLLADPDSEAVAVRGEEEHIGSSLAERCRLSWKYFRPLLDVPNVEARMHSSTLYASMFRFDDDLLLNHHLLGAPASQSSVQHLHRLPAGRLFGNAVASLERAWHGARPVTGTELP
ncbi:XRE family transcriptional regulator [Knoellia locipacati]|uniref:XRE family transcriptional regulator n=1 Tax=Knoellia locipacati TaxID=882824 RepID=A0A512T023_9MICO|nr:helix-turn-helix transcriptional regulator [Knoellia locipacati]GEQ13552.1 XRE family transcriptional regulator [Knoellia locipacati]